MPLLADVPLLIAHRGASRDAPENTLAAFRLAWRQGADGIEADFRLTKDGHVVCIHDETTGRTAGRDLIVAEATLAQLRRLDVGRWKGRRWAGQKIPTLEEVLAAIPEGKRFFIEIKSGPETIAAVKAVLARSAIESSQLAIISLHAGVIAESKIQLPDITANWLTRYHQEEPGGPWYPTMPQIIATLREIAADGLGSQAKLEVVNEAFVRQITEAGFPVHVWTVNEPEQARALAGYGVRSITTDRPGYLRAMLAAQNSHSQTKPGGEKRSSGVVLRNPSSIVSLPPGDPLSSN